MTTRERLIFADAEYPAGTACELAPPVEAAELLSSRAPLTRAQAAAGELLVIRLGGALRIVTDAEAA